MIKHFKEEFFVDHSKIHLNNAGLAPISRPARDKIHYWAERFYHEGFYTDHDYMNDVLHARTSLSTLIGCNQNEIAFFQSTASAISQICFHFPLEKDDEVIMWDQEYASNLYPWQEACKRNNANLVLVKSEDDFTTPAEKIIEKINDKTKVIAISWVQFQTGAVTDLKRISDFIKGKNIFFFVDVMQGLGLFPFSMFELEIDAIAGGSHKWLVSPVGVGFLAIKEKHISKFKPHNVGAYTFGTCDDPTDLMCVPKNDAYKFEAGSKQVLEITALGASIDLILKTKVENINKEVVHLAGMLHSGIRKKGHQVFYNNGSIVNFIPKSQNKDDIIKDLKNIPCNFAIRGPGIRFSPHAFNREEEVARVLKST